MIKQTRNVLLFCSLLALPALSGMEAKGDAGGATSTSMTLYSHTVTPSPEEVAREFIDILPLAIRTELGMVISKELALDASLAGTFAGVITPDAYALLAFNRFILSTEYQENATRNMRALYHAKANRRMRKSLREELIKLYKCFLHVVAISQPIPQAFEFELCSHSVFVGVPKLYLEPLDAPTEESSTTSPYRHRRRHALTHDQANLLAEQLAALNLENSGEAGVLVEEVDSSDDGDARTPTQQYEPVEETD